MLTLIDLKSQGLIESSKRVIGRNYQFYSSVLNEEREIFIYKPQGLWGMDEDMIQLPVIYVLDAESQFNHTVASVDFLSIATNGNDFMPRSIVVGIANTNNRTRDLTPVEDVNFVSSGGGKRFLQFITTELIPFVDEQFNTANHRTIIGHSFGGLIVFEALLRFPRVFNNYLAFDPGFGIADGTYLTEVLDSLNHADYSNEHIFCSVANNLPSFMNRGQMEKDTSSLIKYFGKPNQRLLDASESNHWKTNFKIRYYPEENHYSIPHPSTYDGLKEIYDFYSFAEMQNYYHPDYRDRKDLVTKLKQHYEEVSNRMGYECMPMQGYLNPFAFGLNQFDRKDLALDLLNYNIDLHPENPLMYNNLAYLHLQHNNKKEAIKLFKKSTLLKSDDKILQMIEDLKKEEK